MEAARRCRTRGARSAATPRRARHQASVADVVERRGHVGDRAGCRYRLPSTSVPRRSRPVRQASAVSTVHPSRTGPSITTSEGSPGMKWS